MCVQITFLQRSHRNEKKVLIHCETRRHTPIHAYIIRVILNSASIPN